MSQQWRNRSSEVSPTSHFVWRTARTIKLRKLTGSLQKMTVGACYLSTLSLIQLMSCMLRWTRRVRSKVRVKATKTLMEWRSMSKHKWSATTATWRRRCRRRKMSSSSNLTSTSGPSLWRKIWSIRQHRLAAIILSLFHMRPRSRTMKNATSTMGSKSLRCANRSKSSDRRSWKMSRMTATS